MIERGFKLFQPWATHVVRGKLHLLVRSFSTTRRERVAVIATEGIDGVWLQTATEDDIRDVSRRIGAVGSVAIVNCIKINEQDVKQQLVDLSGNDYWDYYPKYLIQRTQRMGRFSFGYCEIRGNGLLQRLLPVKELHGQKRDSTKNEVRFS